MRKKEVGKGAHAAKRGAILFLCTAIVCGVIGFGTAWKRGDMKTNLLDTEMDKISVVSLQEAEPTPAATEILENMEEIEEEPTPQPKPTGENDAPAPANPLMDNGSNDNTGYMGNGEKVQMPLSGLLIGIDPGHQARGNSQQEPIAPGSTETKAKVSSGTQGTVSGIPEYVTNLEISFMLRDALVSLGAEVQMTRTTHEVDVSNIQRALMFNEANADLVLRIHCNGSSNPDAEGIGLYVTKSGPIAEESRAIAEVILENMVLETGADKDGVFRRDTYTGLNWSEVPTMIVEMGFMSNPREDLLLQDPEYRQKLVTGMVKGIAEYYGRSLE